MSDKSIRRITRIKDYTVYHDYTWPSDLPEFGRYNLIYGWNGTGKTSLSRIFRYLEKRQKPSKGRITVKIEDTDLTGGQFVTCDVPIRVFNRDFISDSVFTKNDEVAPIYIVGETNVKKQKEVDSLKEKLISAISQQSKLRKQLSDSERKFDQFCIDRAREIKNLLSSSPANQYNTYNKTNFQTNLKQLSVELLPGRFQLSEEGRERCRKQHHSTLKYQLSEIEYDFPDLNTLYAEARTILKKTVVATVIDDLKSDPELASWVKDGISIHKSRSTKTCMFCNQPIPPDRLKELESHFNDKYISIISEIDSKIREINTFITEISNLQLPKKGEFYDDLSDDFIGLEDQFSQSKKAVISSLNKINKELVDKKNALFESQLFDEQIPSINSELITNINSLIQKHNMACDEFSARVLKARKDLEKDTLVTALNEYDKLDSKVSTKQKDLQKYTEYVASIKQEITQLEREIVEHREPAERLNNDLRRYLGHGELQLEIQDTGYRITRGGELADGISEGEQTAIALLYFLMSLEDRRFNLKHGIVVLDDPVSSLDANALFYASGFIRERTESANQLFILTHNFSFFREVRNWFHHLPNQKKKDLNKRPARFFMINCCIEQGKRCAKIERLDELLERHESEYHYLFSCIYQAAIEQNGTALKQNYILPNLTRRLLEAFMAFRQPQIAGNLWKQFEQLAYDKSTKVRILRFINTYSHLGEIGEPEHDLSILSEAQSVIREVLDLMAKIDKDHVDAMISIATEANHDDVDGD